MAAIPMKKEKNCSIHTQEPLKFYCTAHNLIVCSICAVKRHKLCNDVLTFSEAIERFEREDKNLFKALENQGNTIEKGISVKNSELGYLCANVEVTKTEIGLVCEKMHDVINSKRENMYKYVDELAGEEEKKIKDDIEALHNMLASTDKAQKHAEHAFDKKSALGVIKTMVGVQNVYCDIERSTEEVKDRQIKCLSFQHSDAVQEIIDNFQTLGFVSLTECEGIRETEEEVTPSSVEPPAKIKFVHFAPELEQDERSPMKELEFSFMFDEGETSTEDDMEDSEEPVTSGDDNDVTKRDDTSVEEAKVDVNLNIVEERITEQENETVSSFQTVDHVKPCWLYGIAYITTGNLAITDVAHDSIQVFDIDGSLVCEKIVSFTPWDITRTGEGRVAVSAGGRGSIYLFELSENELISTQFINVGHDCICISYADSLLTVGTRSGIVTVSEDGHVLAKIDKFANDGENLRRTDFVAVNSDTLFLTNTWRNKIVTMNSEGHMLWEFEGQGHNPRGIVWHDGGLFVCSRNRARVLVVDESGTIKREIASGRLDFPYAIAHQRSGHVLAITQWDEKIDAVKSRTVKVANYHCPK